MSDEALILWGRICRSLSKSEYFNASTQSLAATQLVSVVMLVLANIFLHSDEQFPRIDGAFPDAIPFLKWCLRRGIVTGVISNADDRYGDSILPLLGLADDMRFLCFSKSVGHEKPQKQMFDAAMRQATPWLCLVKCDSADDDGYVCPPLRPDEVLHIGNDFKKDYLGAKNAGFHAILLDRYDEIELASSWREQGAPVFKDLIDVVEYLGREGFELGPPRACPFRGDEEKDSGFSI